MTSNSGYDESSDSFPWPSNWATRHVPEDLWREIFKLYDADERLNGRNDSSRPLALFLCRICSHWREIVISSPELWNRISVYFKKTGYLSPSPQLVDLMLRRAGSVPLKISLDGYPFPSCRKLRSATRDAVQLLFKNLRRAEDIDINTDVFSPSSKYLHELSLQAVLSDGTPLLRNLLFRMGTSQSPIDPRLSRIWTLAPNLRSVVIHESSTFAYSHLVNTVEIPFGQLTSLRIAPKIPARCLYDLLSDYRNLVVCIVEQLYWGSDDSDHILKPILLPALQYLSIEACIWEEHSLPFLAYLETPALSKLNLYDESEHNYGWCNSDFACFLKKSSCSIRHFGINILRLNLEEKLKSLRLLSELTTLTLRVGGESYFEDIEGWEVQQAQKILMCELGKWDKSRKEFSLLPRLQKITIDYEILPDPDHSAIFANLVEDRGIAVKVTNIQEPDASRSWGKWCPRELLRLLVLKNRGFDVELDPPPSIEAEVFRPHCRLLH